MGTSLNGIKLGHWWVQGLSPHDGSGVPAPGHGAGGGRRWMGRGQQEGWRGWGSTNTTMFRPKHE